jgi:ketosteroid isomerase-like protein
MTTLQTPGGTTTSRSTKEIVLDYYNAQCAGDLDRLRELLAPDVKFHYPQSSYRLRAESIGAAPPEVPDPYMEGREVMVAAVEGAFQRIFKTVEPPDFVHVVAEGDIAVVLSRSHAVMQDGTQYHQLYSFHARVEDGMVSEVWEVHDTMYAFNIFLQQPALQAS